MSEPRRDRVIAAFNRTEERLDELWAEQRALILGAGNTEETIGFIEPAFRAAMKRSFQEGVGFGLELREGWTAETWRRLLRTHGQSPG